MLARGASAVLLRVVASSARRRTLSTPPFARAPIVRPVPRAMSGTTARSASSLGAGAAEGVHYHFSSAFDSGNGELVSATPSVLTVRMREEPFTDKDGRAHLQWFHFRVTGAGGSPLKIVIANAGDASYPDGWHDYKAFCSADRVNWHRVPTTSYEDGALIVDFDAVPSDCVHLAYFVPYHYEKHLDLVARAAAAPTCRTTSSASPSTAARSIACDSADPARGPPRCSSRGTHRRTRRRWRRSDRNSPPGNETEAPSASSGSSAGNTPANPWRRGGWKVLSRVFSIARTPWRRRCCAARRCTWCRT